VSQNSHPEKNNRAKPGISLPQLWKKGSHKGQKDDSLDPVHPRPEGQSFGGGMGENAQNFMLLGVIFRGRDFKIKNTNGYNQTGEFFATE